MDKLHDVAVVTFHFYELQVFPNKLSSIYGVFPAIFFEKKTYAGRVGTCLLNDDIFSKIVLKNKIAKAQSGGTIV